MLGVYLGVYVIGRDILRAVFNPRHFPLAWPIQIAAAIIVGLVIVGALYVALILAAGRWLWRIARR